MRVLQIVPSISLVYGGPSQMVLGLSAALASQGIDVTILTTNSNGDAGQPPLDVPLAKPIEQQGYRLLYFPCSPFRRYKFSGDLLNWLKTHASDYDIAHLHALFSPVITAAATIARSQHLPYILRPLGTLDPADLQKKKWLKKLYGWGLERPNLQGAAGVHFTTTQEANISQRYGVKTQDFIIPLGVSLPDNLASKGQTRSTLGIKPDIPLILFMSRLDPKKGLNLLIEALETLQAENLPFHWVLAGSNPQDPQYEQRIRERIQQSSLATQTTITGFVEGETKYGLLQDADLFVLPSYYENFGIAVAEAMVMGLPVVVSRQVYIADEIEQGEGGWVGGCDVPSLTDNLRKAFKDPEERQKKGENAQKIALSRYSWEAIAQQTINTYEKILRQSAK